MAGRTDPQYVSSEPWIWNDQRVLGLSEAACNLLAWLLTCPYYSKVPGLILAGSGTLRDGWRRLGRQRREAWEVEREMLGLFAELQAANLVLADWELGVVYVRILVTEMVCNGPKSISRAGAWGTTIFKLAPKCELISQVDTDLRELIGASVAMMQSYLHCTPLSTADAERMSERPQPHQPRQESFSFPSAQQDSAPDEDEQEQVADHTAKPGIRLATVGGVAETYEAAEEALVQSAPTKLNEGLPLSKGQRRRLRERWLEVREAGVTVAHFWQLGAWIEQGGPDGKGGLRFLNKITPATYLGSHLEDALRAMTKQVAQQATSRPGRALADRQVNKQRLEWVVADKGPNKGRTLEVCDPATKVRAYSTHDSEQELEILDRHRRRWKAGEEVDVSRVQAELEAATAGSAETPRIAATIELLERKAGAR